MFLRWGSRAIQIRSEMKNSNLKNILILSLCVFVTSYSKAQSLSSSVIGSTGEQFSSSSGSLEWTLGEIMTETYQQGKGFFTQGFHQPATIKVTSVEEVEEQNLWVYPNPTREALNIKISERGDYLLEFFNLQGQKLINRNFTVESETYIQRVDLQEYAVAVYLLRISNTITGKNTYHKIEKN